MLKICLIYLSACVFLRKSYGEQAIEVLAEKSTAELDNFSEVALEKAIDTFEKTASFTVKTHREGALPIEESEKLYDKMVGITYDIQEIIKDQTNAYKFLKLKGIDRIIIDNLDTLYVSLKTELLELLKKIFEIAPTTTNAVIPIKVIDKLLDIFENEDNLALKAHAVDILYMWLPKNPKIQTRVMKLKGLEPFYHQITKLDSSVVHKLLKLFNIIVNEHLEIHKNKFQKSRMDSDKLILYQRIGLIERLSTLTVCNGLLDIFQSTWSHSLNNDNILGPVFELIIKVKPYCLKKYEGKAKAAQLFKSLLDYVKEDDKKEYLKKLNMNATEVESVLTDYVDTLKSSIKDEL